VQAASQRQQANLPLRHVTLSPNAEETDHQNHQNHNGGQRTHLYRNQQLPTTVPATISNGADKERRA